MEKVKKKKTAVENKRKKHMLLRSENLDINYLADCDQNMPSDGNIYCCTDLTTISASSRAIKRKSNIFDLSTTPHNYGSDHCEAHEYVESSEKKVEEADFYL